MLGGRHLVGIFILLIVIFGVVFTLGYLLGRNQYDLRPQAASTVSGAQPRSAATTKPEAKSVRSSADTLPAEPPSDWDFYHAAEPPKPIEPLPPPRPRAVSVPVKPESTEAGSKAPESKDSVPKTLEAKAEVPDSSKPAMRLTPAGKAPAVASKSGTSTLIPHGATVLQVAALAHESDALALAQALQKKKFPAFVLDPPAGTSDHFYRVQVGPYGDSNSANVARDKLEVQGFKSIVKR